jgi:hypothetical protein
MWTSLAARSRKSGYALSKNISKKGPQISPLRCAPVEMTKERVVVARDRLVGEACSVPHPQFPEEKRGFAKLHAPFLGPQDPGLKARPGPTHFTFVRALLPLRHFPLLRRAAAPVTRTNH